MNYKNVLNKKNNVKRKVIEAFIKELLKEIEKEALRILDNRKL